MMQLANLAVEGDRERRSGPVDRGYLDEPHVSLVIPAPGHRRQMLASHDKCGADEVINGFVQIGQRTRFSRGHDAILAVPSSVMSSDPIIGGARPRGK